MTSVCLYFKVHQPYRLNKFEVKDIDVLHCYEDDVANKDNINRIADECYLPANNLLLGLIKANDNKFKISFSLSGIVLELLQSYRPDVISSFKKLIQTGCVEILAETYYHSLSALHSHDEFGRQIEKHAETIKKIFKVETEVFRNTELIHYNDLAKIISGYGFKGLLCEGTAAVLKGRSPNHIYAAPGNGDFGLLLRNQSLSDDIAFRFEDSNWSQFPLTGDKFAQWIHSHPINTEVINLFMDYETFGVHKKEESGIFEFLKALPAALFSKDGYEFLTPSEALEKYYPKDIYDAPSVISWEDKTGINGAWCENVMQNTTLKKIYCLEKMVMESGCEIAEETWGRLQSADYLYYMGSEAGEKRSIAYKNPYPTAEEAFQNYTRLVADFEISVIRKWIEKNRKRTQTKLRTFNLL